jgi:hypothetical protein
MHETDVQESLFVRLQARVPRSNESAMYATRNDLAAAVIEARLALPERFDWIAENVQAHLQTDR